MGSISVSYVLTRAGALAGVGLALDPEGKKSVLIQPSSFELKKILQTLITVDLGLIAEFCGHF